MYYSTYSVEYLTMIADHLRTVVSESAARWCIFDNTTLGAATGNALVLERMLA